LIYSGKAKTAANFDTEAEIKALMYKRVLFDKDGSDVITIDTAATDAAANGLVIVGGDYQTSTVWFVVALGATIFSNIA